MPDISPCTAVRKHYRGFTLLEMAIVLIIISVLIAISTSIGKGKIEEAREMQTVSKLDKIEQALQSYRTLNNRLPCPGNQVTLEGSVNYGLEANNPGRCTGGTIAASYIDSTTTVADGSLPFQALGLPEEFMYDGWGRRFTYAVQLRYTAQEAFESYEIYDNCTGVRVNDVTGAARTTTGVYAVISHGQNGHGAYTKLGTRYSDDSANAMEQANCNCDLSASDAVSHGLTYYQASASLASTNTFDDYVRFRERWQMQTEDDRKVASYAGPEAALAINQSPYVTFYSKNCETFTRMSDPATLPASATTKIAVSADNNYWAVGGASTIAADGVIVYKRNSSTGALTALSARDALAGANNVTGIDFSFHQDANYMAVGYDTPAAGDYLRIYRVLTATDTFTRLYGISGPNLPPSGGAADIITALAFHPSGKYLVVASNTGSTGRLSYYTRVGDVFTVTADGVGAALGVNVNSIAFSPDGAFMAVGLAASPFLKVYSVNATTGVFTPLAAFATMPTTSVSSVSFDRKSRYLAVGQANSTASLYVYRTGAASFTAIKTTGTSAASVQSTRFSPRQSLLVAGEDSSDPARAAYFVPVEEYFPLPAANTLPTQPVASRAADIALRNRVYIY